MCGRYGRDIPWPLLHEALNLISPTPSEAPNLEPEWDIRPTTSQWIARPADGGTELVRARWWLVPFWHRGPLKDFKLTTFNAKAETVAKASTFREPFARRRCLVPASCWYEWTGPKWSQVKWRFTPKADPWLCFAGLWDRCMTPDAGEVVSFTVITQPAGSPLNGYHDRAPVVVSPDKWSAWLDLNADPSPLLGPESADAFVIEPA
jgi:putative SOS response-associated peptidase YedK